jgi:hypothetical protein
MDNFPLKSIIAGIVVVILLFTSFLGVAHQDAQEVLVAQSPGGTLTVYTTPGWHFVPFSKTTYYPKRSSYEFKSPIRFNDGGQATMLGSIQYEIPVDEKTLIDLHSKYGSAASLKAQLVERVVDKSIFMSGPLMSSRESYAERKAELVNDVEDQIARGIYQTRQKDQDITDPITGVKKTVTAVEVVNNDKGVPQRQEEPILQPFGIRTFNFTIGEIDYNAAIEAQIKGQQQITMDVQTAIANAKKAEQNVLTVTKQGEANAAEAKWKQEVLKAQAVTAAQQELEVAKLMTQKADQEKQALILKAEGESEYKRKIIVADGALQQKLAAYVETQKAWAEAVGKYQGNWVPSTVMGGANSGSTAASGGAQALVELLTAKTAKDLSLDMSVPQGQQQKN